MARMSLPEACREKETKGAKEPEETEQGRLLVL
jgi:hypothetical protein